MAVIRYKCTVCNREIEIIERPAGLEHLGPCNITNKCRGELYRIARLQDYAVGRFPDDAPGLTNYIQRNVVYNHTQAIADSVWLIEHNLGVNPTVQVIADREETIDGAVVQSQIEIEPELVTLIDKNTLTLTFNRPESGIAQIIARSTAGSQDVPTVVAETLYLPVTTNRIITLAVDIDSGQFPEGSTENTCLVRIYYLNEEGLDETAFSSAVFKDYDARSPIAGSAWNDTSEIFVNGETYTVLTIDIGDPVNDVGAPSAGTVAFQAGRSVTGFPYDQSANMVVLLSNPPHANTDKIRGRIFRPDWDLGPVQSLDSFILASGELLVDESVTEKVFPPVFSVTAPQTHPSEPEPEPESDVVLTDHTIDVAVDETISSSEGTNFGVEFKSTGVLTFTVSTHPNKEPATINVDGTGASVFPVNVSGEWWDGGALTASDYELQVTVNTGPDPTILTPLDVLTSWSGLNQSPAAAWAAISTGSCVFDAFFGTYDCVGADPVELELFCEIRDASTLTVVASATFTFNLSFFTP